MSAARASPPTPALRGISDNVAGIEVSAIKQGSAAFLGIFCSAVALFLWARAVSTDGIAKASATLYFEPFVTLAAAVLLLDEPQVPLALVGGPIVLLGVWLVGRAAQKG